SCCAAGWRRAEEILWTTCAAAARNPQAAGASAQSDACPHGVHSVSTTRNGAGCVAAERERDGFDAASTNPHSLLLLLDMDVIKGKYPYLCKTMDRRGTRGSARG